MKDLIYHYLLEPQSADPDLSRREFILNILLVGLFVLGCLALLVVVVDMMTNQIVYGNSSLIELSTFLIITCVFWIGSRAGLHNLISYILLVSVGALAIALILQWSFELPMAELSYGLMVVVSGVLLSARAALLFSSLAVTLLAIISWQQVSGRLHPRTDWLDQPPVLVDVLGYAGVFGAMGLVSWLANREIDRSLKRARSSEAALALERDSLEVKVARRTKQLEIAQQARTLELQRFAEFGRVNAHLLHEIANPLTAASLNLEQYGGGRSSLIQQARKNLSQLEAYLKAARQQLQNKSRPVTFSISNQLRQVDKVTAPLAKARRVKLIFSEADTYKLHGDVTRFNQIMSNLVTNAIQAYPTTTKTSQSRVVGVTVSKHGEFIEILVMDRGAGISKAQLPHIFESFYTTKRSLGLGLALVKQYVEIDFRGSIAVSSSPSKGTTFTLKLRNNER